MPCRTRCRTSPECLFARLLASRQAVPGRGSYCGGRAARRLRCGARSGVALRNSLRSLRSLRSDNRSESDHEARCARRPHSCAPRRHRNRPHRVPPAARKGFWFSWRIPKTLPQSCARAGRGAPLRRRGAQGAWPCAQRTSSTFSSRLSERRERSERSEFRDAAMRPSTAGQSTRSATVAVKRRGLSGRSFAARTSERKPELHVLQPAANSQPVPPNSVFSGYRLHVTAPTAFAATYSPAGVPPRA